MSPFLRHRLRRFRAVTFLELMIVLIIMMVFVGLSFPLIKGAHSKSKMAAAAREFAMTVRLARQQAILRHQTVEVCVEFEKDRYWLDLRPEGDNRRTYSSYREKKEEIERMHEVSNKHGGLALHSVQSSTDPFGGKPVIRIKFFKDGSASPSTVIFGDEKPRYMTVEIAGATGNVRAYAGRPEGWDEQEPERRRGRRSRR